MCYFENKSGGHNVKHQYISKIDLLDKLDGGFFKLQLKYINIFKYLLFLRIVLKLITLDQEA